MSCLGQTAAGTQFGDGLRKPKRARTLANRNKTIVFGAYRVLMGLLPSDKAKVFDRAPGNARL
ncbi:MAG: hypothetical protein DMG70_24560 [Acidobacteria bacterium]|nr:MAG: hypothetical protein DMG70_24560 [Acidobacteriota bacterium]PYY09735.1 MAG: hypothetical protein DMG69_09565 [Acidobacteriota bacterium]